MGILGWTIVWVGLSFALYIFVAWRSRVADTKGFYVAGMGVPPSSTAWPPRPTG